MNKSSILILLFTVLFFSCTKSKDDDPTPTPVSPLPTYNWYAGQVLRSLDTLKVENGYLYYSAEGLDDIHATQQFTLAWAKGGLDGDFEMTLEYEALNSDLSGTNIPFSFTAYPTGDLSKILHANLGTNFTSIQYGNGGGSVPPYDTKISYSGTVFIKRTGADFAISITKNYLNGATPAQYVLQGDQLNWFSGKANFSFMVLNSLSAQRARIRWTSMSIKNAQGTVVESFDTNEILMKK